MVDYEAWVEKSSWTIVEGSCLMCGIEPIDTAGVTNDKQLYALIPKRVRKKFIEIYEMAQQSIDDGTLETL